jgi:glycosyltransferase involved in cell wall biosynthesis
MQLPEFSVIIPTRRRPDTLRYALQTAVAQDYPDTEIIVHEVGADPLTAQVVAEIGDHRTRHVQTDDGISMSENWERAVSSATGRYLTMMGDDDGILPTACSVAAQVLERFPSEMLTWHPAAYFWPSSLVVGRQNRLQAYLPASGCERQDPRILLERAYRFQANHYSMPMILHSVVSRELIDRVKRSLGSYFHSTAPDIASAVVDAFYGSSCILVHRIMSMHGLSHNSTGSRLHFTRDASLRLEAEKAAFDGLNFHPSLPNTRNSILFAANEMLIMKQRLFPDTDPTINYVNLIQRSLDSLNAGLDDYETGLADIRRTASLNGVDMERFMIPPPSTDTAPPATGVKALGPDSMVIDIDCSRVGVCNVAEAARLLSGLLPPFVAPVELPGPSEPVRTLSRGDVDFSSLGNGALALRSGWDEPESWGVWSVARRADVVFDLGPRGDRPRSIRIEGRMFVHPKFARATGSVALNGRRAGLIEANWEQPQVVVELELTRADFRNGRVVIEFRNDEPINAAAHGLGVDRRYLGFGLERMLVR